MTDWNLDVDVVVVTYQSAPHLPGCLRALPPGTRVVVVDNASTDGSAELAEALGCEVLRNQTNAGFGRAVNRAVRERARAAHVLLLNPDASVDQDNLERLLAAVRGPGVAVAAPALRAPDGSEQRPWWQFPSPALAWREALGLHRLRPPRFDRSADVDFVVGACFLMRTEAFRSVGGFDERFWLYGEEADLCRRLHNAGWRVRYESGATATHVGGASGHGTSELVAEHFARGPERFVLTHNGVTALVSFRVANVIAAAARVALLPRASQRRAARANTLRRSIRALLHHPTLPSAVGPAVAVPSLVVCSLEAWDEIWRRNQFFVRELTDADPSLRVLFVEPAVDPLHELLVRRQLPSLREVGRLRVVAERPQVIRFRPVKILPRRLGRWADSSLVRQVQRAAARAELNDPTLWLNNLGYATLAERCTWPLLYDITDDWLAASASGRELALRAEREARVIDSAGVVVSCSEHLARTKRRAHVIRVVPDAVDVDRFQRDSARPRDLPDEPVAVYVGTLHDDRIDVDLVRDVATRLPDVRFVFVGPDALSDVSRTALTSLSNVKLLGPRPYVDVPAYYQHATVIVIPHAVNAFTESLDPIKAYECMAAGRPTLATPAAGFRELGPPIVLSDATEFSERLRVLVADPPATLPIPTGLATWTTRAEAFASALADARHPEAAPFDPPLRVVYLGHVARRSGAELALLRVLPALQALGIKAHVILGEDGPLVDDVRQLDISVEVLPLDPAARDLRRDRVSARLPAAAAGKAFGYTMRLARRLRELRPDVVHTNTLKAAYFGGLAGRLAGVPVVWHIRDRIASDYLPPTAVALTRALSHWLPDAVVANSRATLATLAPYGNLVGRVPDVVVPSAVPPRDIRGRQCARPFTVGMLGRISPWKGQHVFIEAFARAFPNGDERAAIIGSALFGEHDYERSLNDLCQRLGVSDRVTFAGHRDDVFEAFDDLDVLVHASTVPEPFGQVVLEGMAAGLPVIATAAGGPLEIITHGIDGLLVPPGDARALAGQLARLATDPALRQQLGEAARERAVDFHPEHSARRLALLYRQVLGRRLSGSDRSGHKRVAPGSSRLPQ